MINHEAQVDEKSDEEGMYGLSGSICVVQVRLRLNKKTHRRMIAKNVIACILATGFLLCSSGWSLAMRCGNDVVKTGDSRLVVRNKCGEPHDIIVSP